MLVAQNVLVYTKRVEQNATKKNTFCHKKIVRQREQIGNAQNYPISSQIKYSLLWESEISLTHSVPLLRAFFMLKRVIQRVFYSYSGIKKLHRKYEMM